MGKGETRFDLTKQDYNVPPFVGLVTTLLECVENVRKEPKNCRLYTLTAQTLLRGLNEGLILVLKI